MIGAADELIPVVDLVTGKHLDRDGETLTLDIPPDFDRQTGGVFVDGDRLGRYRTAAGESRVYIATPRRLAHRRAGEECLVVAPESESSGTGSLRRYWRSVVKPSSH